ncbi:Uma2 family endonuclease [Yinghuangia aomiensis]|uniref:Uma2 family endonuclease n=1 Tax=Yinghuangia aomiensis TaxID=676205 RepID=UPI0031E95922
MRTRPQEPYGDVDPERALKYAVQRIMCDRAEVIEGVVHPVSRSWGHESVTGEIRTQLDRRVRELGCGTGSGNIDLPGSCNWYGPDLAVAPDRFFDDDAVCLRPDQTLLVVEVTSPETADTDRRVKRARYSEYEAPLFLLVDRDDRTCTLFSGPLPSGYALAVGPHPFGTPIPLPEPFALELDTSRF